RAQQGEHPLVRDGGRPPARHRHDRRSRGRGHPHRASLCAAGDGALWRAGDRPRLAGDVQHARGHRRPGARAPPRPRGVRLVSDLNDLYQEVILDHNRRPRNFHAMADATHRAEGYNPLCGDRLTLYMKVDGDTIADVAFEGAGCAISKASASMMTDDLQG